MRLPLAALVVIPALFAYSVTATAQPIKQVEVVNLLDPQNVTGSVEVTNLPAVQDVNVVSGAGAGIQSLFLFEEQVLGDSEVVSSPPA